MGIKSPWAPKRVVSWCFVPWNTLERNENGGKTVEFRSHVRGMMMTSDSIIINIIVSIVSIIKYYIELLDIISILGVISTSSIISIIIIRATYWKYHKHASQNWSWLLKLHIFIVFFSSSEGSIVSGTVMHPLLFGLLHSQRNMRILMNQPGFQNSFPKRNSFLGLSKSWGFNNKESKGIIKWWFVWSYDYFQDILVDDCKLLKLCNTFVLYGEMM